MIKTEHRQLLAKWKSGLKDRNCPKIPEKIWILILCLASVNRAIETPYNPIGSVFISWAELATTRAATVGGNFPHKFQDYLPNKPADICPSYISSSGPARHTSLGVSWHLGSPNLQLMASRCRSTRNGQMPAIGGLPAHKYKPSMTMKPSHRVRTGFTPLLKAL